RIEAFRRIGGDEYVANGAEHQGRSAALRGHRGLRRGRSRPAGGAGGGEEEAEQQLAHTGSPGRPGSRLSAAMWRSVAGHCAFELGETKGSASRDDPRTPELQDRLSPVRTRSSTGYHLIAS